jgi:glycosyltransferase involved in cell wall biosynthesis
MENQSFFIINMRYTPGNWQHMESFADCLLKRNCRTRFIISSGYRWMTDNFDDISYYTPMSSGFISTLFDVITFILYRWRYIVTIFRKEKPAIILLVTWHPLNYILLLMAKYLYPNTLTLSWLHEPYKENKDDYRDKAIIIYLIEFFQTLSLRYTDVAILHSHRGLRLFDKRYPNFKGRKRVVPLQFQDDGFQSTTVHRYVTFLGRADRAKGIDLFYNLVARTTQGNMDLEFQIVTSSDIQNSLEKLDPTARRKMHVVNRPQIYDAELRDGAANSLAVMALYKETMQSGVIPLALMKGTPVIGTDIEGITEWIRDRETGVIVPPNPSVADITAAIAYIQSHFAEMSQRCRASYLATFDDRNWDRDYGWLGEFLPCRGGRRLNFRA